MIVNKKTDTVSWTVLSGKQIVLPIKETILLYVSSVYRLEEIVYLV
jgi:hypothetical protein